MIEPSKKPRVVYEQYLLAHYSVPVFTELSKHVDLLVVLSGGKSIDGVKTTEKQNLPFQCVYLPEGGPGELYHPGILDVLEDFKPDILLSFETSLRKLLIDTNAYKKIKSLGISVMLAGCDGYGQKHPVRKLIRNFFRYPRSTFRNLVAMSRIDCFLIYSSDSANYFHFNKLVPRSKIRITGNAIDTSVLNATTHALKASGVIPQPHAIAFSGRLTPTKKPETLVRAFQSILKTFPDATLNIIGDGSEKERLHTVVRELDIEHAVTFSGAIHDDKEMATQLSHASLFVMPGLGGLGFNTAMACGLPIIYTDADGTEKDLFAEKESAWYFDGTVEDLIHKITDAFSHPERMKQSGKRLEQLIMNTYTIPHMMGIYVEAMKNQLKSS